jgi:hypothetical protein
MRGKIALDIMAAFRSTGARQNAEALHTALTPVSSSFDVVRVEPFHRPLGTFHQHLLSTPRHRVGKAAT